MQQNNITKQHQFLPLLLLTSSSSTTLYFLRFTIYTEKPQI